MTEDKIRKHFKDNKLPKPGVINLVGQWVHGERLAITCGLLRLKSIVFTALMMKNSLSN